MAGVTVSAHESEMVARAQEGDREIWEKIYQGHGRNVYLLIVRMVINEAIAEELTQDVFLKAWKSIGGFRGESGLGTWLHRIGVRLALNHLKKSKFQPIGLSETLEQFSDDGRQAKSMEQSINLSQDMARLEKATRSLPDSERIAFTLHHLYKLPYAEVADLRGVKPTTVRHECFQAIQKLRKELC